MVETGRAVAFVMDDILLYGLVARRKTRATSRSSTGARRRALRR